VLHIYIYDISRLRVKGNSKIVPVHTAEACSWRTAELSSFFNLDIRRSVKVFNMLPSYIKIDSDNPKKFKLILQKFYMKISFICWMKF